MPHLIRRPPIRRSAPRSRSTTPVRRWAGVRSALLSSADLFVTTYHGREQAVSGALTFALAAGLPVVSTPYRYAEDLLADGAGRLVPFGDSDVVAEAIEELVAEPSALAAARTQARRVGAAMSWPAVGRTTAALLGDVVRSELSLEAPLIDEPALPPMRLDHLATLVDDVGIIQHAVGAVPNRSTGYCVDDVARLAVVSHRLERRSGEPIWSAVTRRAIAFLVHAAPAHRDGMHNMMSYDRRWSDRPHRGDHVGRTIQALGELVGHGLPAAPRLACNELLDRLITDLADPSPRTAALALIGLARADPSGQRWIGLTVTLAELLCLLHEHDDTWNWFEPALTYDNARLPQALVVTGARLADPAMLRLGLDTLAWLGNQCGLADGLLRLPGHLGRRRDEGHPGRGDQQPIDASAFVDAEIEALRATGDARHGDRAHVAFAWFAGRNRLGAPLYDAATGGCRDGLGEHEVNINEGAESTLAYFAARLALEEAGLPLVLREHTLRAGASPAVAAAAAPGSRNDRGRRADR